LICKKKVRIYKALAERFAGAFCLKNLQIKNLSQFLKLFTVRGCSYWSNNADMPFNDSLLVMYLSPFLCGDS